jgi:Heparinase II/III N-terminus/Heparinase II/III-like protein
LTTLRSKLARIIFKPALFVSLIESNISVSRSVSLTSSSLSCEDICRLFPRRIKRLFSSLDLSRSDLSSVKHLVEHGEWSAACKALVNYYQYSHTIAWLRHHPIERRKHMETGPFNDLCAQEILNDTFTFQLTTGQVPRRSNGWLDWSDLGPNCDREWAWFLNRHYHLVKLLEAYSETGQLCYVECINQHLTEWILSSPSRATPQIWAQWRGLEVAYRMLHWPRIFYGLQQVEAFTPETRILMLSSLLDHAQYLRYLHDWGDNWVFREMYGLANLAICWPEFKSSPAWLNYAGERLNQSVQEQVYPDGAHKELTSHYHRIVLRDIQGFADALHNAEYAVSNSLRLGLEKMWNYLAYTLRPSGLSLLNNDSDQENQKDILTRAAITYGREDWRYITSNGQKGIKPEGEPSRLFPWAGHFVMRSGWDTKAHWAFFDIGPLGVNYHVHQDKLHVSLSAYGRDLLVDSGRYSYVRSDLWTYFRNSASHNVILIDEQGQKDDLKQCHRPITNNYAITPELDFVMGNSDRSFHHLPGHPTHTRVIAYLRGQYWVVVDRIETDRPRNIEVMWHFHPDCTVSIEGTEVLTEDKDVGNLRITPVSALNWQVKKTRGQENPKQGWWSREYGHICPNDTAVYQAPISTSSTFAWIFFPYLGIVPKIQVTQIKTQEGWIHIKIEAPNHPANEVAIQLDNLKFVKLLNGIEFKGHCAIVPENKPPHVVNGVLRQAGGKIIAQHPKTGA